MSFLTKIERFIDIVMSLSTLVGFCSTLYLVWLFIHTTPQITITTTNVGAPGVPGYSIQSYVIQGVPFFWIFTSLVSLSAGHTYRSAKHLILTISGRNPFYNPHNAHVIIAPKPITPKISQAEANTEQP
jgi:hypothetical protein